MPPRAEQPRREVVPQTQLNLTLPFLRSPPYEQAAEQARARRKTKSQKAQEAAEKAAREEEQRLLSNTKTLYRHHRHD